MLRRLARLRAVEPLAARSATGSSRRSKTLKVGDVADFANFMGAVIDAGSFTTQKDAIEEAKASTARRRSSPAAATTTATAGSSQPTVIETTDPDFRTMQEELFGPVVTAFVYDENALRRHARPRRQRRDLRPHRRRLRARPRRVDHARDRLRYAAGNFYVNDKPTGAVVGQQPFGGARASGTNDKAGSMWNLIRWVCPRTIKETFVAADATTATRSSGRSG